MNSLLPCRSDWEQLTVECYDSIADEINKEQDTLFVDRFLCQVMVKAKPNPIALDLGCGSGRCVPIMKMLGADKIVGIDGSQKLINIARENFPGSDFLCAKFSDLVAAVGDMRFDVCFSIAAIMHVLPENVPTLLKDLRSIMNQEGVVFIATPSGDNEEELLDKDSTNVCRSLIPEGGRMFRKIWDPADLMHLCAEADFQAIYPSHDDGQMFKLVLRAV